MPDINLLPAEEKRSERAELLQKRLSMVAFVLLATAVVTTVATLGFFISVIRQREAIDNRIQEASGRINSLKSVEELLVVTKDKASTADKLLGARVNYLDILNILSEIVPTDVYFSDIKLGGAKVTFAGKARTSADMAALASSFSTGKGAEMMSGVSIDQLGADETGIYSFVISSKLGKENK